MYRFNVLRQPYTKVCTSLVLLSFALPCAAGSPLPKITAGSSYADAKQQLIAQGWQPLPNPDIAQSSLYAQALAEQGMPEVVDCISMALDGCRFRLIKKKQVLEITTITRQLSVETIQFVKAKR